jgi:hypothetical protein
VGIAQGLRGGWRHCRHVCLAPHTDSPFKAQPTPEGKTPIDGWNLIDPVDLEHLYLLTLCRRAPTPRPSGKWLSCACLRWEAPELAEC